MFFFVMNLIKGINSVMNKHIILKRVYLYSTSWLERGLPSDYITLKMFDYNSGWFQVGGQYLTRNKQQLKAKSIIIIGN